MNPLPLYIFLFGSLTTLVFAYPHLLLRGFDGPCPDEKLEAQTYTTYLRVRKAILITVIGVPVGISLLKVFGTWRAFAIDEEFFVPFWTLVICVCLLEPLIVSTVRLHRINLARADASEFGNVNQDEVIRRIERAFENVKEFIGQDEMRPKDWKTAIRTHREMENVPVDELYQKLDQARVFDGNAPQYERGRNLVEAVMYSVWLDKKPNEEVLAEAAKQNLSLAYSEAKTSPNLEQRRIAEFKKKAAELELYGDEPITSFDEVLENLGGTYRAILRGQFIETLIFKLRPGTYFYVLIDRDRGEVKQGSLAIGNNPFELKLSPSVKRGELRISNEHNVMDTIPLD